MDPTQPVQNIPPIEHHTHSTSWLVLILIAAISLALAGGAIYFAVQKQTPEPQIIPTPSPSKAQATEGDLYREPTGSAATANWKTYTNKTYGFELKYPPRAKVTEGGSYSEVDGLFISQPNTTSISSVLSEENGYLVIKVDESPLNPSLERLKEELIGSIKDNPEQVDVGGKKIETLQIGGEVAVGATKDGARTSHYQVNLIHKNKIYRLDFLGEKTQVYDQILSTFRFSR